MPNTNTLSNLGGLSLQELMDQLTGNGPPVPTPTLQQLDSGELSNMPSQEQMARQELYRRGMEILADKYQRGVHRYSPSFQPDQALAIQKKLRGF